MDGPDYSKETTSRFNFIGDILKLLERGSLNDVKIKLCDGEMFANKDILMARSDYFATMFSNNKFIEGETCSVDMSHCSKAVMEIIIKMIFSGIVEYINLSMAQLLELSHMAEMMLFTKLKAEIDDHVKNNLDCYVKNFISLYNSGERLEDCLPELISSLPIADQYNLLSFKLGIIKTVYFELKAIPDDVKCSDSFKFLPFSLIKDIFQCSFAYVKLKCPPPPTTMEKTKAFMIWLSENEITEEQKNEILDSFDFEDFTVEELMTSISDSGLYPAKKINERVLKLFKKQEQLLKEKESRK